MTRKHSARHKNHPRNVRWLALVPGIVAMALGLHTSPASASPANNSVAAGGMTRLSGSIVQTPEIGSGPDAQPSCANVTYPGDSGHIAVQERNNRLQWGIVMTPPSNSVGKWDVDTYLNGQKTTSGFHRDAPNGYLPHGSLAVPSNQVFHVQAKVVGPSGTFVNMPNGCRT